MRVKIEDISYYLPKQIITNHKLHQDNPSWNLHRVEERSGVVKRHIARDHETALDLAFQACERLFARHPHAQRHIDGLIFCTQSEDYVMPSNACLLHKLLDLPEEVFAFDFNLACSGYIYGLALAQGLIQSGITTNTLLVTADTYSKFIHSQDRSARVLFGDAGAVSWITASKSAQGLIDTLCATSGKDYRKFIIPAGGCRLPKSKDTSIPTRDTSGNIRTLENIHMDGMGILAFVNSRVPPQIRFLLKRNRLTLDDIDLFIFHQASKMALDSLTRLLKIPPHKVFTNLRDIGNTVSASIPIALKDALTSQKISRGDTVLLSGFGVGLSWGSALMKM